MLPLLWWYYFLKYLLYSTWSFYLSFSHWVNVWLFWDLVGCSLPGSSLHVLSQRRILEWVAISFSRRSSWSRERTHVSFITGRLFTTELPEKPTWSTSAYQNINGQEIRNTCVLGKKACNLFWDQIQNYIFC